MRASSLDSAACKDKVESAYDAYARELLWAVTALGTARYQQTLAKLKPKKCESYNGLLHQQA